MSKDALNVLSVDWDYFINIDNLERAHMFPDGGTEDLADALKTIVWAGHYLDPRLKRVGILFDEAEQIRTIIEEGHGEDTRYMIADSHRHIVDFLLKEGEKGRVNLVNVDHHHDAAGGVKSLHCGNWLLHLRKELPVESTFRWIARKDSEDEGAPGWLTVDRESFESIRGRRWDLVFICRSGMWSPPHLDKDFIDTFEWITEDYFTYLEQDVFKDRNNESFAAIVEEHLKMRDSLKRAR